VSNFTVSNAIDIEAVRAQARADDNDDMLGGIESLAFALQQGLVTFPARLELRDPLIPDAIIYSGEKAVAGVEVTRASSKRHEHVRSEASKLGDCLIEITPNLFVDEPGRRGKNAPKGSLTGDFAAIKTPGQETESSAWPLSEAHKLSIEALRDAVDRKRPKLEKYRSLVNPVGSV
jgi:hypothetical protein